MILCLGATVANPDWTLEQWLLMAWLVVAAWAVLWLCLIALAWVAWLHGWWERIILVGQTFLSATRKHP